MRSAASLGVMPECSASASTARHAAWSGALHTPGPMSPAAVASRTSPAAVRTLTGRAFPARIATTSSICTKRRPATWVFPQARRHNEPTERYSPARGACAPEADMGEVPSQPVSRHHVVLGDLLGLVGPGVLSVLAAPRGLAI